MAKRKQDVVVEDDQVRKKLETEDDAANSSDADHAAAADISGLADIAKKILRPTGKASQARQCSSAMPPEIVFI